MSFGKEMRRHGVRQSHMAEAFAGPPSEAIQTSPRCRVTHDVPYRLRCVLDASHAWTPLVSREITSGEFAGQTVAVFEPHKDKDGRTW
jgi:hypothetical protein